MRLLLCIRPKILVGGVARFALESLQAIQLFRAGARVWPCHARPDWAAIRGLNGAFTCSCM